MARTIQRAVYGLLFVLLCGLLPSAPTCAPVNVWAPEHASAHHSPFLRRRPPSAAPGGGSDPLDDFVAAVNALSPDAFYVAEAEYLTMSGAEVVVMEDVSGNGNDLVPISTGPGFNPTGSATGRGELTPPGRLRFVGFGSVNGLRISSFTVGAMTSGLNSFFLDPGGVWVFGDDSPPGTTLQFPETGGSEFGRDDDNPNNGTEHCYAVLMRSTGHLYQIDGVTATEDPLAGTGTINDTYADICLLTDAFLGTDASPISCHIFFSRELSGGDLTALEAAISDYYGITFSALERPDDGTRYATVDAALYRVAA